MHSPVGIEALLPNLRRSAPPRAIGEVQFRASVKSTAALKGDPTAVVNTSAR